MTQAMVYEVVDLDPVEELFSVFQQSALFKEYNYADNACIASISVLLHSLHWHGNNKHLMESMAYRNGNDFDMQDLLNTMANIGFTSHRLEINVVELDKRLMPCILICHEYGNKPIVLINENDTDDRQSITAYDAAERRYITIPRTQDLNGTIYFFQKIDHEKLHQEYTNKKASGYRWFMTILFRFKPLLGQVFLVSVVANIITLSMPIFVMMVYDKVIGAQSFESLYYLVFGVAMAVVIENILRFMRIKTICWVGTRIDNIVSNAILERLLLIPISFTEGSSISSQMSRLKAFESVRDFFTGPLFMTLVDAPFTLILLVAIYFIAGPLVLVPIVTGMLYLVLVLTFNSSLRIAMLSAAKASSTKQQFGMETFIKIHALRYNGLAKKWLETYKELASIAAIANFRSAHRASIIETIAHGLSIMAGVATVAIGVELIWAGKLTIGALVGAMIIIWRVLAPLQTICSMLPILEQLKNSIAQVNALMDIEPEHSPHQLKKPFNKLKGNIKFSNVGLRYNKDNEPVFVGLDLNVSPGEIIAITGSNGSGKTTILSLINGLCRPQAGNIRIDGIDIRQLDPVELRRYISYMSQEPDFFYGTIRENLLFANPFHTDEEIYAVLEKIKVLKELQDLPDGLDTKIYSHNSSISSGLAYSLSLARIFLKPSNILLLDELPNSSLNSNIGVAYTNLILESRGKNTVFFVTHRDDYIKLADKVVVLQAGSKPKVLKPDEVLSMYGEF